MTVKELSQLYYLTRETEADQKRLAELEAAACAPGSVRLDGMPRVRSQESKVERLTCEIVDLQAIIAARQIQCLHERARLERWISDIPDSYLRQIFHYRFIDGLTWQPVAFKVGGGNTSDGVRMACMRYLGKEAKQ